MNLRKIGLVIGRQAFQREISIQSKNVVEIRLIIYSQEMIAKKASVPAQTTTPLTSLAISVVLEFSVIAWKSTTIDAAQTL